MRLLITHSDYHVLFDIGIKDRFTPGWLTVPGSHFHEIDVAGQKITGLVSE
jgi:hypothetical protein